MNVTRIQLEALAKSPTKAALLEMSVNKQRFSTMRGPVLPKEAKGIEADAEMGFRPCPKITNRHSKS